MALVIADRVRETSTTTGAGAFTLNGAVTGYQTFLSAIGAGNTCYYTISNPGVDEWEVGIGTVGSGTLTRTTLISSSTGSFVSFTSGSKDVFVTYPAEKAVYLDAAGAYTPSSPVFNGNVVISDNSANAALRVTQTGSGNALVVEDSANPDATQFRITGDGLVLVGGTPVIGMASSYPNLQVTGYGDGTIGTNAASLALNGFIGTGSASHALNFNRSNGAAVGTNTIVANGDQLGNIRWGGADGTNYVRAAQIVGEVDGTPGTNDMPGRLVFSTTADGASSPTERMRINSAGEIGIGAGGGAGNTLLVQKQLTGATSARGIVSWGTVQSDVTAGAVYFSSSASTAAASFTVPTISHFSAGQGTFGLGSTVTTQYGFVANSTLTGATNNYGFYGSIAAGTGRYNFYAAGTADNYFAGNVGLGTTTPGVKLDVADGFVRLTQDYAVRWHSAGTIRGAILADSSSSMIFQTGSTSTERGRVSSTGVWSFGALPGAESLRVTPVASAVNYWNFYGGAASGAVAMYTAGSDTNIATNFVSKGNGSHTFFTNSPSSAVQFNIAATASAVNYLQATGNITGYGPSLTATGSDANIPIYFLAKGAAPIYFIGQSNNTQFAVNMTASAVNYLSAAGSATGNAVTFAAQGSDTNISLTLAPKGTGIVYTASSVGIGSSTLTGYGVRSAQNITGGTAAQGIAVTSVVQSDVTTSARGFYTALGTQATAFTAANLIHFYSTQGTIGAGSAVTNQYGYAADSSLTGATNNYGFHSNIASGTGRWNFYAAGTADNYFAGNVGVGSSTDQVRLNVSSVVSNLYLGAAVAGGFTGISYNRAGGSTSFISSTIASPFTYLQYNIGSSAISLGAAAGSESLRVTTVASAVNYVNVTGAIATDYPVISAQGSDTDIRLAYATKGNASHYFRVNGVSGTIALEIASGTSVVNGFRMYPSAAGANPTFEASGADTNLDIIFRGRGTGGMIFRNAANATQFTVASTASAVNYLQATGQATGGAPYLSAQGSDANINMLYLAKGTGGHVFTSSSGSNIQFAINGVTTNDYLTLNASTGNTDLYPTGSSAAVNMRYITKGSGGHQFFTGTYGSGVQQFNVAHTASTVSYLQVAGSSSTFPALSSQGSSANVDMLITAKGTGAINLQTNYVTQFRVADTASAVNWLQVTGAATGASPVFSVQGSDTNIDLTLTPKGTGNVKFGTLTANADAPITGYITIKDSAGNLRKLAVIA